MFLLNKIVIKNLDIIFLQNPVGADWPRRPPTGHGARVLGRRAAFRERRSRGGRAVGFRVGLCAFFVAIKKSRVHGELMDAPGTAGAAGLAISKAKKGKAI